VKDHVPSQAKDALARDAGPGIEPISMTDLRNFEELLTLKNGMNVKIRAIRSADNRGLAEAFAKLDPDSIYGRFFQPKASLSANELKAATEVDFEDVVALVVTTESQGREIIIGGGRYMAFDHHGTRAAEVAFMIEEDYHRLGIAGHLLRRLARVAQARGIRRLEAAVLAHNRAMLAVFERSGLPMSQTLQDGVVSVTLSLAGPP
jgi:RimJ/RimL family protein N-acetyltransferase